MERSCCRTVNLGTEQHWRPSYSLTIGYFTIISTLYPSLWDSCLSALLASSHHGPLETGNCIPEQWWIGAKLHVSAMLLPKLWLRSQEQAGCLCLEWGRRALAWWWWWIQGSSYVVSGVLRNLELLRWVEKSPPHKCLLVCLIHLGKTES